MGLALGLVLVLELLLLLWVAARVRVHVHVHVRVHVSDHVHVRDIVNLSRRWVGHSGSLRDHSGVISCVAYAQYLLVSVFVSGSIPLS